MSCFIIQCCHQTSTSHAILPLLFIIIWVLQPVKIISLILNRVKRKAGRKFDIPEKKTPEHQQAELGLSLVQMAVSRIVSVDVCSEGRGAGGASLAHHLFFFFFFSNCCGLATLTNLNIEMYICHTTFGIVMLVCDQS